MVSYRGTESQFQIFNFGQLLRVYSRLSTIVMPRQQKKYRFLQISPKVGKTRTSNSGRELKKKSMTVKMLTQQVRNTGKMLCKLYKRIIYYRQRDFCIRTDLTGWREVKIRNKIQSSKKTKNAYGETFTVKCIYKPTWKWLFLINPGLLEWFQKFS